MTKTVLAVDSWWPSIPRSNGSVHWALLTLCAFLIRGGYCFFSRITEQWWWYQSPSGCILNGAVILAHLCTHCVCRYLINSTEHLPISNTLTDRQRRTAADDDWVIYSYCFFVLWPTAHWTQNTHTIDNQVENSQMSHGWECTGGNETRFDPFIRTRAYRISLLFCCVPLSSMS